MMEEPEERDRNKQQVKTIIPSTSLLSPSSPDKANTIEVDKENVDINYDDLIKSLRSSGQSLRADREQPNLLIKPSWFDEKLFENAKSVYERHFMGTNFAHLSGLLLLVRVDSIYNTLKATGESSTVSKLFKRYFHTVKHVKIWYEGNIFEENSDAHRSLLIVRGMHNKVSTKLNENKINHNNNSIDYLEPKQSDMRNDAERLLENEESNTVEARTLHNCRQVHISEYDIMITQFAFIGFIVTNANKMGFLDDFNDYDMKSLLHFWRIIGYLLGASDKYNLCSYELDVIEGLCQAIMRIEYKQSLIKNHLVKEQGIMGVNIVRSLKFIPMLTVYGIMRYLYEIVDYDTNELSDRRGWYSNLSYTFIKLVMTNLLAYKPLRSFNNGLTRLSLYLVGKIENWFSNHLESKYGHELKI